MRLQFLYEDGQGITVYEDGKTEPMDYIIDQEQYASETISSHTQYLQAMPAEEFSPLIEMQIDKPKYGNSCMRDMKEKRTYTSYTPHGKARFFKLKN